MKPAVVVIAGPTGSGKTTLSLSLASLYDGEIINADASQIRRGLDIGTAKTAWRESAVKHHLFDIIGPDDDFSIRDYQALARPLIEDIASRGRTPFLVGGSGLYINAALGDYDLSIPGRDPSFDRQFDDVGNEELHNILKREDPKAAKTIHPNNRRRVLRAIEAARAGKKVSENRAGRNLLYRSLILCLRGDRETLYARIDERVEEMFAGGWVEEVRGLIARGVNIAKIKEIGYREIASFLAGALSLEEAKTVIKTKTRRYAKRQLTWFRNQTEAVFIAPDYDDFEKTVRKAKEEVDIFFGGEDANNDKMAT